MATLVKLHTLHGNNWKAISNTMGRSVYALQKRFTSIGKTLSLDGPNPERPTSGADLHV